MSLAFNCTSYRQKYHEPYCPDEGLSDLLNDIEALNPAEVFFRYTNECINHGNSSASSVEPPTEVTQLVKESLQLIDVHRHCRQVSCNCFDRWQDINSRLRLVICDCPQYRCVTTSVYHRLLDCFSQSIVRDKQFRLGIENVWQGWSASIRKLSNSEKYDLARRIEPLNKLYGWISEVNCALGKRKLAMINGEYLNYTIDSDGPRERPDINAKRLCMSISNASGDERRKAVASAKRAFELSQLPGQGKRLPGLDIELGDKCRKERKFEQAIGHYRRAMRYSKDPQYIKAAIELASTYCELGSYDESRTVLGKADNKVGQSPQLYMLERAYILEMYAVNALAERNRIHTDANELPIILEKLQEAWSSLNSQDTPNSLALRARIELKIAQVLILLTRYSDAKQYLDTLLGIQPCLRSLERLQLDICLADWHISQNEISAAIEKYGHVEAALISITLPPGENEDMARHLYSNFGYALLRNKNYSEAEEYLRKAIQITDCKQVKFTGCNDWLVQGFDEESKAYHMLTDLLVLQGQVNEALVHADSTKSKVLANILSADAKPVTSIDQIRQIAEEHNVHLVEYSFSALFSGVVYIWVVPPDKSKPINFQKWNYNLYTDAQEALQDLPEASMLASFKGSPMERMYQLTDPIKEGFLNCSSNPSDEEKQKFQNAKQQFDDLMKDCYKSFILPLKQYLPESPDQLIMIVGDPILYQLPFNAFRLPNNKKKNMIIDKYTIFAAPSAQILAALYKRRELQEQYTSRIIYSSSADAKGEFDEEADKIGEIVNGTVLKCKDVSKQALTDYLGHAWCAHFATHSHLDFYISPTSSLVGHIALGSVSGSATSADGDVEDTKWYASEISGLNLPLNFVFLNTCCASAGARYQEGIMGISRGFMEAGTSTVIASPHITITKYTKPIAEAFYSCPNYGEQKAHSLRSAILQTLPNKKRNFFKRWAVGCLMLQGLPD